MMIVEMMLSMISLRQIDVDDTEDQAPQGEDAREVEDIAHFLDDDSGDDAVNDIFKIDDNEGQVKSREVEDIVHCRF